MSNWSIFVQTTNNVQFDSKICTLAQYLQFQSTLEPFINKVRTNRAFQPPLLFYDLYKISQTPPLPPTCKRFFKKQQSMFSANIICDMICSIRNLKSPHFSALVANRVLSKYFAAMEPESQIFYYQPGWSSCTVCWEGAEEEEEDLWLVNLSNHSCFAAASFAASFTITTSYFTYAVIPTGWLL